MLTADCYLRKPMPFSSFATASACSQGPSAGRDRSAGHPVCSGIYRKVRIPFSAVLPKQGIQLLPDTGARNKKVHRDGQREE